MTFSLSRSVRIGSSRAPAQLWGHETANPERTSFNPRSRLCGHWAQQEQPKRVSKTGARVPHRTAGLIRDGAGVESEKPAQRIGRAVAGSCPFGVACPLREAI